MTDRTPLPARRPSETRKLTWAGKTIFVTIGYDEKHQHPRELFYNGGYRSGSDMEALVSDLCIEPPRVYRRVKLSKDALYGDEKNNPEIHS